VFASTPPTWHKVTAFFFSIWADFIYLFLFFSSFFYLHVSPLGWLLRQLRPGSLCWLPIEGRGGGEERSWAGWENKSAESRGQVITQQDEMMTGFVLALCGDWLFAVAPRRLMSRARRLSVSCSRSLNDLSKRTARGASSLVLLSPGSWENKGIAAFIQ
jgi:hypothetical protein